MTIGHDHRYALPPGHRLGEYRIDRYLGSGGFGITYLATVENLDLQVAIKEYLPSDFAVREADNSVVVKSASDRDDFEWGRKRFLDEARSLARFNHPNIVGVQRFFEAHGTSYIVMDYVEGEPLSELLERKGTLTEAEVRQHVLPLANGLEEFHRAGLLHRDLKLGNIVVHGDGVPVLIDFGSARHAMGLKSRSVTSVVTPGYAPLEQYATKSRQGPATDIYSFGAVLYRCVTGVVPDDATERAIEDRLMPATKAAKGNYSPSLLAAIDAALAIRMEDRPESMAGFLGDLVDSTQTIDPSNESGPSHRDSSGNTPTRPQWRRPSSFFALAIFCVLVGALGMWLALEDSTGFHFALDGNRPEEQLTKNVSEDNEKPRFDATTDSGPNPGIPKTVAIERLAILSVTTEPEAAEVLISSQAPVEDIDLALALKDPTKWVPLGNTPLEQHDVQPGTYQIVLRYPHYQTVHLTNKALLAGKVLRIDQVLERGVGAVTMVALPRNAWVEYDGKRLAETTPITLEELPAGELEITLGATGHRSVSVEVLVQHDEIVFVEQKLEPVPTGTLTLDLTPKDATVILPDVKPVYRPGVRLSQGNHRIVVSRRGYQGIERMVEVIGDTQQRIELVPNPHPFTVIASPGKADIRLLDYRKDYAPGVLMPPGSYRVKVSADGYEAREVVINHGTKATRQKVELKPLPRRAGEVFSDALKSGGMGPAIVVIPAGRFKMGCVSNQNCRREEKPVHEVRFAKAFGMGKFEVTFAQWDACLSAGGCNGIRPNDNTGWQRGRGNRPVYNVNWNDARAFALWLSRETGHVYRLPSESEWEYAARAGSESKFSWGAKLDRSRAAISFDENVQVGSFPPNRWGLHDMHGNVGEWVEDCWNSSYAGAPSDGRPWKQGDCTQRIWRGGLWLGVGEPLLSLPNTGLRAAARIKANSDFRRHPIGFRVVRELVP